MFNSVKGINKMSGGAFDYEQYKISRIADQIEHEIYHNSSDELNEYGDKRGNFFSDETIVEFKHAVELLRRAEIYATRIDWLLSGDDGENTFHERLKRDLDENHKRSCLTNL